MMLAQRMYLDVWWSGLPNNNEESYPVFIGKQLGIMGAEYELEVAMSSEELQDAIREVQTKFKDSGLQTQPHLVLQVELDT
jgi:hypothetical protein